MGYEYYEEEREIGDNESWFDIYVKLPKIILIVSIALFFICGIVLGAVFESFGITLLCWAVGIVSAAISFVMLKIIFSANIIQVNYLRKIDKKLSKLNIVTNQSTATKTKLLSGQPWICLKCHTRNSYDREFCIGCFTPRDKATNAKNFTKSIITNKKPNASKKESAPSWTCPKCGEKNNPNAKNCIGCFEPNPNDIN